MTDTLFDMPEAKAPTLRLRADKPVYNYMRIQIGQNLKVNLRDGTGKIVATVYGGERMAAQIVDAVNEKQETMMGRGDCAKLREALKTVKRYLDGYTVNVLEMRSQVDAALAAPPRNCDAGTARQQEKRHKEEVCPKSACPQHEGFVSKACRGCFAMWAQMPCKEGGAK